MHMMGIGDEMVKIGVILAGAASKGVYELGVMRAIGEYFGLSSVHCVSSASIGMLVAQSYGTGRSEDFVRIWKGLCKKPGSLFLSLCGNNELLNEICRVFAADDKLAYEHYVSVWNYTRRCVEYIPFHTLSGELLRKYIRGAIAIPLFSRGEIINGERILDGAFLDNIPAYPLADKDLDFVFCVYFDNCNYTFEGPEFNRKVIKLFDFPNTKRLESISCDQDQFDSKLKYGYDYTMNVICQLFDGRTTAQVYDAISEMEKNRKCVYQPRLTADVVLNNINVVTKRYGKRLTNREKID